MTLRRPSLLAIASLIGLIVAACGDDVTPPAEIALATATPTREAARTPRPTSTPSPPAPPGRAIIAFTGDVMLDRDVERLMATEGPGYPFEAARSLFEGVDLTVINLEGTFTDVGTPLDKKYQFATDPRLAIGLRALPAWGVSLSNNHATDYGIEGLRRTIETLDALRIARFGAGLTEAQARGGVVAFADRPPGIAFLGYSDIGETIFASGTAGGVARASVEAIAEDVAAMRAIEQVDFVVVTLHMGTEYTHVVTARQQELARAAIDAGADLVVGHHPHVLQPIEEYETEDGRTGLILYSLGNFVFDLDDEDLAVLGKGPFQSVVAVVTFEVGQPLALELRPAWIDVAENRPRPATPEEAAAILAILRGE